MTLPEILIAGFDDHGEVYAVSVRLAGTAAIPVICSG